MFRIKVPRKFRPLLDPCRYKGCYGGRGSGKSHFFAEMVILRCIRETTRVVCIREVQNSIRESVKQLLIDKIDNYGLHDHFQVLEHEIRCSNGSLVIFKGMQSYNSMNIKSLEGFDVAWCEEAQSLSQVSLDLLRPTIRKPNSELWFSWNPQFKTDAVDKFFRSDKPGENKICIQANWNDNPWFKETPLYKDMLDDYKNDPDKAEHVWGGGYGQLKGSILGKWVNQAEREGRIHNGVIYDPNGSSVVVSCDLGYRDTTAWWYWQPVIGGFNLLSYDADTGLDADDWGPRVLENLRSLGVKKDDAIIWMPHDAKARTFQSKRTSQERFQSFFGVSKIRIVSMSKKSDQIEAARDIIKRCAFNAQKCSDGLDGLRAWEFIYNDNAGIFSREPNHNWASHPADAFSYGAQVVKEHKIETKSSKPKFWHEQSIDELWEAPTRKRERI